MIGTVGQIIALISHGNRFLSPHGGPEIYPQNSSFRFCNQVDFRLHLKKRLFVKSSVSTICENPNEWFRYLKDTCCKQLRFHYRHSGEVQALDDYNLAGLVGGGGHWLIEACYGPESVLWNNFWDVTEPYGGENRIWHVTYITDGRRSQPWGVGIPIAKAKERLLETLHVIRDFAHDQNLDSWKNIFETALTTISSDNPEIDFPQLDLLPEKVDRYTRQVFYSAAKAWVFGGMGWWNDNWFEVEDIQTEFQRVTSNLFDAVNEAYGSVLNG